VPFQSSLLGLIQLSDFVDFDFGQILTVAVHFLIPFPAFLFENDHLVAFQVIQDFRMNRFPVVAHGNQTFIADHEYIGKLDFVTGVSAQTVYKQFVVFPDFELLPCDIYDCEHNTSNKISAKVYYFSENPFRRIRFFRLYAEKIPFSDLTAAAEPENCRLRPIFRPVLGFAVNISGFAVSDIINWLILQT
jgi:hypothetical protein